MGIEPTSSAWKAEVLPLNYTRLVTDHDTLIIPVCFVALLANNREPSQPHHRLVEGVGFEPT